jgi:hypothetical protein
MEVATELFPWGEDIHGALRNISSKEISLFPESSDGVMTNMVRLNQ